MVPPLVPSCDAYDDYTETTTLMITHLDRRRPEQTGRGIIGNLHITTYIRPFRSVLLIQHTGSVLINENIDNLS